ncbi:MAG TPA: nuclear transport factor 2 family protein [Solirubrobacterales bacterium]|nr:nuclear transport factor 2 family protein [Solirubrobacterales bacterium]
MIPDPERFAADWYASWNAHDLDGILSHYGEDVVFTSPFVADLGFGPDGRLVGKEKLRAYFRAGLERFPDLHFEPLALLTGSESVVLYYRSVEGRPSAEMMLLGSDGLVREVFAHYG